MATKMKPQPLGDVNAWNHADCVAFLPDGKTVSNRIKYVGPQQVEAWAKRRQLPEGTEVRYLVISPWGDYLSSEKLTVGQV